MAALAYATGFNVHVNFGAMYWVGVLLFTAASSFIIGLKMRRKIRKDLGRKATDMDLADIDTWMEVEKVEEDRAAGKDVPGPK